MDSNDKVVVITGGSMGIGEAIAKIFVDHGAKVVLLSRDASRAEAARQRIGSLERTLALACDVKHREEIDRAIALTLHHFQKIDIWINNAGVGMRDTVAEMEMGVCRELFETNLFGAISCMQAIIPVMRPAGGGMIINISSVAGHIPLPYGAPYSGTKFAMNAMGKAARLELLPDNIHVLTVCPGYVATDFGANLITNRRGQTRPKSVTRNADARSSCLGA
jgi:NAD(P)-dependent dehydrogenase (short-subunit alcohol dehydrogenase family)